MNEELELSISELRRKKRAGAQEQPQEQPSGDESPNWHADGEEPTWARPAPGAMHSDEPHHSPATRATPAQSAAGDEGAVKLPFDPFRLIDAVKRKWWLVLLAAAIFGGIGLSWLHFGARSQVQVQLLRHEAPAVFGSGEEGSPDFHPQRYLDQSLVNIVQSSEVVRRACAKAKEPTTPAELARSLVIYPEKDTELVTIIYRGKMKPAAAVDLLNAYANEVVQYTRELQSKDARAFNTFLSEKLAAVNRELASLAQSAGAKEPLAIDANRQTETLLTQLADYEAKYELLKIDAEANNPLKDKLQLARDELTDLLLKYTDEHPFVQRQREKIKALEQQLASAGTNSTAGISVADATADNVHMVSSAMQKQSLARQAEQLAVLIKRTKEKLKDLGGKNVDDAVQRNRYQMLQKMRDTLAGRQREAEMFQENAPGYYSLVAPATPDRVFTKGHIKKALLFAIFGAFFGAFSAAGLVVLKEAVDDRVKTVADLERATGLPVIGALGDLTKMDAAAQRVWAFRTWTILKGRLTPSQNHGFVCGFVSAHHGEGRSTWIKLLVNTANERGLRVLTISTRPSGEPAVHPHEPSEGAVAGQSATAEQHPDEALAPSVLSSPLQIARRLTETGGATPIVHIPLPGWVWNLERRKQWQNALAHWKTIENLVLLVELPPACEPESVLLAEKLPQVVWLTDSGKITLKETRHHMETLRHAGCNLVGAVLNREPVSFFKNQVSRWFTLALIAASVAGPQAVRADGLEPEELGEAAPAAGISSTVKSFELAAAEAEPPKVIGSLFVNSKQRPAWVQRLTLGPGDMVNLGFFGDTNLTKNEVAIGPDGRISYLQATDVMAAGLTIDELRARLDQELAKYYRSPKSIVTPVSYTSKKYYVLGKVMEKGAFTLNRPITLVEAVANARGVETGLMNRNSIDLADLQHSFLIRNGQRIPIDFEKLFNEGDLSQNIPIEPDDFLYFPPAALSEVYVVGEVRAPGVVPYTPQLTLVGALADRGSFNERAFRGHVLVVRGSLSRPQTFVINTHDIMDGKIPDFKLQSKDIIYVSSRPFIKAEEWLDLAVTGFVQSAVTAWAGQFVGPFITKPIFHGIYRNTR